MNQTSKFESALELRGIPLAAITVDLAVQQRVKGR
jgi:hypothetical protein